MTSSKLTIKIFGQSIELRTRLFELNKWKLLLEKNRLDNIYIESNILDPDFFDKYNFPEENLDVRALTLRRFMRNAIYGPDMSYPSIIEIKFDGKKIYRGSMSTFCGVDALFPLANIDEAQMDLNLSMNELWIVFMEKSAGLIFSCSIKVPSFTLSDIQLKRTRFNNFDFISEVILNGRAIKQFKTDSLIRARSFQLLTH